MNRSIAALANSHGFRFLSLDAVYSGHELCRKAFDGQTDFMNWIHLSKGDLPPVAQESFHPNPNGYQATGHVLAVCLATGSCGHVSQETVRPAEQLMNNHGIVNIVTGVITVHGVPLGPIGITLHSEPLFLGEPVAEGAGNWSLRPTIPASVPDGLHTLQVASPGTDALRNEVLVPVRLRTLRGGRRVLEAVGESAEALPRTGPAGTRRLALGGAAFLVLGAYVLWWRQSIANAEFWF
jgi:hypothetical protein